MDKLENPKLWKTIQKLHTLGELLLHWDGKPFEIDALLGMGHLLIDIAKDLHGFFEDEMETD